MITNIRPYNINNTYKPQFMASRKCEEYTAVVSYENFTNDLLNDLVEEWDEEGLIEDGDSVFIMPLCYLEEAAKVDRKIAKTLPKAHLSRTGFAITIEDKYGRMNTEALRYFDPRVITNLKVVHTIKNDMPLIISIENSYT